MTHAWSRRDQTYEATGIAQRCALSWQCSGLPPENCQAFGGIDESGGYRTSRALFTHYTRRWLVLKDRSVRSSARRPSTSELHLASPHLTSPLSPPAFRV